MFVSGRQGYVVRLLNPETASRTLIKGFVGMISELAFSHKDSNTLACVDEGGNVYIWVIHEENGKLEYPLVSLGLPIISFWQNNISSYVLINEMSLVSTLTLCTYVLVELK